MTRNINARIAGISFLLYIGAGVASLLVLNFGLEEEGIAAKIELMAGHPGAVHTSVLLLLMTCFLALVLAATLYGLTRDVDPELALMVFSFRIAEGVLGAVAVLALSGLLWLGTEIRMGGQNSAAALVLAGLLQEIRGWGFSIAATFFGVGSTVFSCLLLRGRLVPVPFAWFGVVASVLIAAVLPVHLIGLLGGLAGLLVWIPMLIFEVALGFFLIIKGVGTPSTTVHIG